MAFHAARLYVPLLTPVVGVGGSIVRFDQVTVLDADGDPLSQAVYDTQTAVTPVSPTRAPNNAGYLDLYADEPQPVLISGDGGAIVAEFSSYPIVPYWYEDVRVHGASPDATASYNAGAIQEAADAVIARGGGVVLVTGRFHIAGGPIEVDANADTLVGVIFQGISTHGAALIQDTASADILCFGRSGDAPKPDIASAYKCGVRDLTLQGGRIGLRLNNAIEGHWKRIYFQGNQIGLQTEGQCEDHWFEALHFSLQTSYGMNLGADNGIGGASQELQKTTFHKTRMHGVLANAINAIKVSGGSGATGTLTFDGVILEDGPGNWIDCTGSISQVTFKNVSVEESSVALTNVSARGAVPAGGWRVIKQGIGCTNLILLDCPILAPSDNFGNPYGYVLDQEYGQSYISNCVFIGFGAGGATNASVHLGAGANGVVMIGGAVIDHTQVTFDAGGNNPKNASQLVQVRDSANAIIANWDLTTPYAPFIGSNANGMVLGTAFTMGNAQKTVQRSVYSSLPGTGSTDEDLGPTSGLFLLRDKGASGLALYLLDHLAHTSTEIADTNSICTNNNTGTVWSIFWLTTSFVLRNKTGVVTAREYQLYRVELSA